MKGLNFESTLTYTYSKSQEQMKNILEQDGFQKLKQNDDLKVVEYTIDHSRQIKLSQLLYLQEIRYIQLNIAQNIQLCLDIIMKYQKLKDQNIQHNYLSSDRIILNLTDQQSQITILPQNLNYTIHFVGYDCPFYESKNYINSSKNDDQSIKEIIINILQIKKNERMTKKNKNQNWNIDTDQVKNNKIILPDINKEEQKKKFNQKYSELAQIIESLLAEGIFKSIEEFVQKSKLIFEKYNNQNNKNQRLTGVDKCFTKKNFKRSNRLDDVIKNLKQIQQLYYKQEESSEFLKILQLSFPLITKELITATFYQNQYPHNINFFLNLKQEFNINNEMIDKMINENKEEIMKDFKFELDIEIIKDDVNLQLIDNKFKILNYFLNSTKFSMQNDQHIKIQIDIIKKEIIKEATIQSLKNYLELKILQLIEDLI
ncbi:unnamed protein product [Paramecium sonneborni]|uniref:Uncharacterized protein n=1 Tax=Paramecium sonneborni TaxID=65129 RepID=A0A8S1RR66_9CILI|nr:unnamed protein product [Paramecium sonneborni]CAD8131331.1 unnamed protein product [Paramecium sonneborni]